MLKNATNMKFSNIEMTPTIEVLMLKVSKSSSNEDFIDDL